MVGRCMWTDNTPCVLFHFHFHFYSHSTDSESHINKHVEGILLCLFYRIIKRGPDIPSDSVCYCYSLCEHLCTWADKISVIARWCEIPLKRSQNERKHCGHFKGILIFCLDERVEKKHEIHCTQHKDVKSKQTIWCPIMILNANEFQKNLFT